MPPGRSSSARTWSPGPGAFLSREPHMAAPPGRQHELLDQLFSSDISTRERHSSRRVHLTPTPGRQLITEHEQLQDETEKPQESCRERLAPERTLISTALEWNHQALCSRLLHDYPGISPGEPIFKPTPPDSYHQEPGNQANASHPARPRQHQGASVREPSFK